MLHLKDKTCCFTGHRKIPPEQASSIARWLNYELTLLIEKGYLYFGAGGALGFDTLAAQTILNLKEKFPQIRLILVLPCLSQSKNWGDNDRAIYEDIKKKADKIVYISKEYWNGCMLERNRHLVDNSSVCIAYLTKNFGGTAYTVEYAKKQGILIINIAESLKGSLSSAIF